MIIPRIDNEIFVVGLTEGPVTSGVVKALSSQDASVRVYLPEEAAQYLAAFVAHHYPLPLVVEQGYDMNSIRVLLVTALQHGVRLVPVGSQTLWEQMVPLEMPELIDLRAIAPDELKVQDVVQAPEPEEEKETPLDTSSETYVVNGTTVCTLFPSLRHSLADLNAREVAVDSAVLPASAAGDKSKAPTGGKRTKHNNHTLEKMLLSAVLAVCVAGIACYLIMVSSEDAAVEQPAPVVNKTTGKPKGKKHTCPKDDAMPELMKHADSCPECKKRAVSLHAKMHEQEGAQPDVDEGCKLECKKCELKKHSAKDHKALSEPELEEGAKLGCVECQKLLHAKKHVDKKIHEFTEAELGEGDALGCEQCRKAVHEKLHDAAGDAALAEADVKKGVAMDCAQCKMVAERQEAAGRAAEEEAARKAAEDEAARKQKVDEHKKCHKQNKSLTKEQVEEGVALKCDKCIKKKKKAHDKRHADKASPLTEAEVAEGVTLGCDKCTKATPPVSEDEDAEFVEESAGKPAGEAAGKPAGEAAGKPEGDAAGQSEGEAAGKPEGDAAGQSEGDAAGQSAGEAAGKPEGDAAGQSEGEAAGKPEGEAAGQSEGEAAGQSDEGMSQGDEGSAESTDADTPVTPVPGQSFIPDVRGSATVPAPIRRPEAGQRKGESLKNEKDGVSGRKFLNN